MSWLKTLAISPPPLGDCFFSFFYWNYNVDSDDKKSDYLLMIKPRYIFLNIIRNIFGVLSIWLYIYSIVHLKLVEITMILWTIPLFELFFSRLFFNDKANRKQLLGAIICFLSIFAMSVDLSVYVSSYLLYIYPLLATILFALQDIIIKK